MRNQRVPVILFLDGPQMSLWKSEKGVDGLYGCGLKVLRVWKFGKNHTEVNHVFYF